MSGQAHQPHGFWQLAPAPAGSLLCCLGEDLGLPGKMPRCAGGLLCLGELAGLEATTANTPGILVPEHSRWELVSEHNPAHVL